MPPFSLPADLDAHLPVLLLPVSVQVKFVTDSPASPSGHALLVRLYPDQLGVSTHEGGLTAEEVAAGRQYWAEAPAAAGPGQLHHLPHWRTLVARLGAPRAQWVLRQTAPTNLPALRAGSAAPAFSPTPPPAALGDDRWTRAAAVRGLPERFLVRLYGQQSAQEFDATTPFARQVFSATHPYDPATFGRPATSADPASEPQLTSEFLKQRKEIAGQTIDWQHPLALGPDPQAAPPDPADDTAVGGVDAGNAWTVDFILAETLGLALTIALTPAEYAQGYQRLVVLGVRPNAAGNQPAGQSAVQELFTDHYYSGGLQLVPQGTPTNNTDAAGAGYSSRERADAEATFALLDATPFLSDAAPAASHATAWTNRLDDQHLTSALGLDAQALPPLDPAAGTAAPQADTRAALALNRALWPATYGYFLEEMLRPLLTADELKWTRDLFADYVLARGSVPALRVGAQPYGVLPTTHFSAWQPTGLDATDLARATKLQQVLARLDATWTERLTPQASRYPRTLGPAAHQTGFAAPPTGSNLLTTLALDATSTEYYQRYLLGPVMTDALRTLAAGSNLDPDAVWANSASTGGGYQANQNSIYQEFTQLLDPDNALKLPASSPPIFAQAFQTTYTKLADAFADEPAARRAEGVLLDGAPALSETLPLAPFTGLKDGVDKHYNYVNWLADASFEEIRLEDFSAVAGTGFVAPNALLYVLLRQAVLLQYWAAARADYHAATGRDLPPDVADKELFNLDPAHPETARWAWLYERATQVNGQPRLYNYLKANNRELKDYLANLARLAPLPTAQLERLLAEHLDLGSYRLDAWRLAPVAQRLAELRRQPATAQGSHLGAFGWLENLRPADTSTLNPATHTFDDPDNLGYIHAPSLTHGTTAALLRQGYKSRQLTADPTDPAARRMAVDVSSRRVRAALALLDGLRAGHSLGTLLGQSLERALQTTEAADGSRPYGQYVATFRAAFPLADEFAPAGGQAAPAGLPAEQAARQVTDGAALLRAVAARPAYPYGLSLPPATTATGQLVQDLVAQLADDLDALGDLAVSEGIYQAARGNSDRAAAVLDSVAKGQFAVQPESMLPPQRGLSLTQRVLVHLPADTTLGAWPDRDTPRAAAAPRLNVWVAQFLPNPDTITLPIGYQVDGAWQAARSQPTLLATGLHPLDLLALLDGDAALQADSAFDRLALAALAADAVADLGPAPTSPTGGTVRLALDYAAAGPAALRRRLTLLARLRQLLGSARPARPHDLQAPGRLADPDENVGLDAAALRGRLALDPTSSLKALQGVATALSASASPTPAQLLAALRTAALFGLAEALPGLAVAAPAAVLTTTRTATYRAAQARLAAAPATPATATVAETLALATALFGADFQPDVEFALGSSALPATDPRNVAQAAYAAAVAPSAATNLLRFHQDEPLALPEWLHGVAAVREPLDQLDKVLLIQGLLDPDLAPALPLQPTQLVAAPGAGGDGQGDYWLGLPWPTSYAPPGDALSLVQWLPAGYAATHAQAALWLDEWTETLPLAAQTTALTFHYDQPNSEAPQTMLLVVSPQAQPTTWEVEHLFGALNETLDLAKKRTVEPDALAFTHLAPVLPAVVLPAAQQAVSLTLDLGRLTGTALFQNEALKAL